MTTAEATAERVLRLLEDAVRSGLRGSSARGWTAELWGGELPWDYEPREAVCQLVEADARFPLLREEFKSRYGIDCWSDAEERRF